MPNSSRANSIAIIGMAARFPGAGSIEQFWSNIAGGVESIARFSDDELLAAGAEREWLERPDFVKAAPVLDEIDRFDAPFFKISRREAEMMDPQQRIMLELAWEALERAGYAGPSYRGLIGVVAGAGGLMSSYLLSPLHLNRRLIGATGSMQCIGNDKDYLATRISYKLNLRGPSLTVQTACSTSLVAVHLACQSLLAGDCDLCLAGGVTIRVPHRMGYLSSSQALLSPDGHCRAFDARAEGTLFGSGAGFVLLKPLPAAVRDGDPIVAVIRGSSVNNDGAAKLSYWAASADGQTAACTDAMAVAEVEPRSIGYLEAHGTATAMGDPVEIFGLTKAFRRGTAEQQFCAIGSVKTNIGHLEAAAGVAGLIKAALSLQHRTLPPSLHFSRENPAIHFSETPFFVNTQCQPWLAGELPRRAAVNSLGIGGTNAHVILEEAPESARPTGAVIPRLTNDPSRAADDSSFIIRPAAFPPAPDLLTLSAKTPQALRELAERYVEYLGADFASPDPNSPPPLLADVAFTAQIGREHFAHRVAVVASSADEARAALDRWLRRGSEPGCAAATVSTTDPPVVFLFSGQDCALGDMGRQLWKTAPVFREAVERCDAILGNGAQAPCQPAPAANPPSAQPALFAFQYALAELWKSWGIVPAAVVGHDVGQYAAACAAGVMSLEDALKLVAARGRLIESFPADGRMLAVMAGPDQVADVLDGLHATPLSLAIAAINSPRQTVVAGRGEAIERLATAFEKGRIRTRWLPISHAFRGAAAGPMADDFGRLCETVVFRKPRVPLISSLTGKLAGEEIAAPDYWRREPFEPIRFADAVATLDEEGYRIFVEIAPQPKLLGLGRRCMRQWAGLWLPSLKRGQSEWRVLLSSLGQLYARGLKIDWASVHRGSTRRRVMLPTYPFQRQRYWIAGGEAKADATDRPRLSTSFPPSISALENGDLERLAEELKSLETFSDEEARLLPRVLRALAKRQKRKTALT